MSEKRFTQFGYKSSYFNSDNQLKIIFMKAIIEKKIRFVDNNVDYIDVQTTIYFLGLPIYWQSKKFVPPLDDSDMSVTKRMYKERVTTQYFR